LGILSLGDYEFDQGASWQVSLENVRQRQLVRILVDRTITKSQGDLASLISVESQ
jgi:hypothetical protein